MNVVLLSVENKKMYFSCYARLFIFSKLMFNPSPTEPGYALPLKTV